jgi:hypothetical protein
MIEQTSSPIPFALDDDNPWPGLREYDEENREYFRGRSEETATLVRLVRDAPLTVLFGRSGLGKSSLLKAGLFPKLRELQFLPVYLHLDPRERQVPLMELVARLFREQLENLQVDHPPFTPGESLWEYLHRSELELWSLQNRLLTPVLVFDQFEEFFTLGTENRDAIRQFKNDLADLVENRLPGEVARQLDQSDTTGNLLAPKTQRYKVVLTLREDYLPDLEGWRRDLPSLTKNRSACSQ